jgi:8-oxo-dGTP diphosphatase
MVQENESGREYPAAPIVAVGTIILEKDCIALVRRAKPPAKGLWTFPGGAVELGESLREAAQRESLEETGLQVEVGEVATVLDHVVRDAAGRTRYHYVIVDYLARPTAGVLQAGSDVSDVCWANLSDVNALKMTTKAQELARQLLSA